MPVPRFIDSSHPEYREELLGVALGGDDTAINESQAIRIVKAVEASDAKTARIATLTASRETLRVALVSLCGSAGGSATLQQLLALSRGPGS